MNNSKQVFKMAVVTDLNFGYAFSDKISASITKNNIFCMLPNWKLELKGKSTDADYAAATLNNPADKSLLKGFLEFSGNYRILGYNGSHFN